MMTEKIEKTHNKSFEIHHKSSNNQKELHNEQTNTKCLVKMHKQQLNNV